MFPSCRIWLLYSRKRAVEVLLYFLELHVMRSVYGQITEWAYQTQAESPPGLSTTKCFSKRQVQSMKRLIMATNKKNNYKATTDKQIATKGPKQNNYKVLAYSGGGAFCMSLPTDPLSHYLSITLCINVCVIDKDSWVCHSPAREVRASNNRSTGLQPQMFALNVW